MLEAESNTQKGGELEAGGYRNGTSVELGAYYLTDIQKTGSPIIVISTRRDQGETERGMVSEYK